MEKMDSYIESYNVDPEMITPRLKPADVVNAALVAYLRVGKEED